MSFWSWFKSIAKRAQDFLLPIVRSEVGKFLADPRVQAAAAHAVTIAAQKAFAKSGDEKHDVAVEALKQQVKDAGIEHTKAALAIAVEAAYRQLQEGLNK